MDVCSPNHFFDDDGVAQAQVRQDPVDKDLNAYDAKGPHVRGPGEF